MSIPRGETYLLPFSMYDSATGLLKSGLSVTASVSKDGEALVSTTNSVAEVSGGHYSLKLTSTEMDAATVTVEASASGALTLTAEITTDNEELMGANVARSVWNESQAAYSREGTFGKRLDMDVSRLPPVT